ncbi:Transposon TX1 uncharacterized 149 kDa protein [Vitis vinifera]|uniref:Transposon TX1 uncharacterized 149 kDa protein n=1 Tax=Vitis vinifera TaxID=29760 RepID=A0A438F6C2_VITVI|nr:Transposon TX1 uncharacterized 149 kDa protein [Vitis vinifera]
MLKMLRAMDPLAHYLFITVMTVVPQFLQGVVDGGLMKGYKVEVEEAKGLRFHNMCSKALSGLKGNLVESDFIPIGRVDGPEKLANHMGHRVGSLPTKYLCLRAQGLAGGILVCWDKRSLELLEMEVGNFSISCRLKNVEDGVVWIFTGVYGPCNRKEREELWEELGAIRGIWEEPWCLGGDFNVTLSQRDRSRQGSLNGAMRRFAQVVDDLALIDLPLQGGVYSWSGGRSNQTWARLDRFLVSQGWLDIFRGAIQCRLPRPTSDHFPILLKGGGMSWGPSPFRFENMWLKVDGFKELLREWWQEGERVGRASFRMAAKMKEMKEKIKVWNRDVFGRVEVNKSSALRQIEFWDRVESGRDLSERETDLKNEAKENFKKWVLLEEAHWRQVSRELWLREGDKNTGFFHKMASAHWRNNFLDRIKINGVELVEEQEVREGIVKTFQHQLREEPGWRADLEGLHLKSLDLSEAEALEAPFTEEEIFSALMDMDGDKAPSPDGFTVAFWQACWDFAKEEIVELFKEFYDQKSFAKSLNATFLVIIPKKGGAEGLREFRPISLLEGLYKFMAKVLANRLKMVLDKVVSADQNAFVRERQILDASLIANEVVDYWQKRKEKGLMCKLDIEKAYDSISWSFLMKVLKKMGFGSRWMDWMWWCFSTEKFSILINGVLAGFFSSSKGLRQRDPISPYLFILGMEVLSALIRRAVQGNFIFDCRLKGRGDAEIMVSHLLFADDTILFCEASKDQLTHLGWILAWFEAAFGLRINLAKSELIPVGEIDNIEEMAVELGCRIGSFPVKYLGLPLGARHKALSTWDGVEERMRRKLARWKRQYLSKGGRITLIKSTLASIPIYQMSIFRMPTKRLDKLQRDFLWGGGNTGRKIHLINWKVVCTQKEKGGLGIRRMGLLNKALLGKWIWRFAVEKDVLWKKVIGVKHGLEGCGWKSKEARGPFGVGVWKEILKEMSWCWNNMEFKVGRGTKIMFWTDHWCGDEALSQAFPQIFALAVDRNELVNDVWDPRLGQGGWNLRLVRDSNDWELVLIEDLLFLLRDIRVTLEEDSVLWKGGDSASFRIRVAYNLLAAPNPLVFPGKNIWVDKWLGPFGKLPLPYLGFSGCFQRRSKRCCSVGGALLWGRGVLFTSRLLGVGSGPLRAGEMLNTYSVSNDLSDELAWRTNHTSVFSWILLCFFDYRRCCRLLIQSHKKKMNVVSLDCLGFFPVQLERKECTTMIFQGLNGTSLAVKSGLKDLALEEVEKNFVTMKFMLSGDGETEPNMEQVSQLTLEICKEDVLALLIHKLSILGWEARKDLVHCWSILLRQMVDSRYCCVEYIENHFELLDFLVVCYDNKEIAVNCGNMLRECIRFQTLAK